MFILSKGGDTPSNTPTPQASHLQRIPLRSGPSAAALNHRLVVEIASAVSEPGKLAERVRESRVVTPLRNVFRFCPVVRAALTEGALLIATGKRRVSVACKAPVLNLLSFFFF